MATVKVRSEIAFSPWRAPNFATVQLGPRSRQDGFNPLPSIPIGELEPDALDAMAEAWLTDLYSKVNRSSPFNLRAKAARS